MKNHHQKENAISVLTRQRELLKTEYEEEKKAFSESAHRIGIERLVSRGMAWSPVAVGRVYYNSLNQRIIEITRRDDETDHSFEYGKPVAIIAHSPDDSVAYSVTGTVNYADAGRMAVAIPENADTGRISSATRVSVTMSFDETSYRAMFDAIDRTLKAKGRLGELRDIIYSRRPTGRLSLTPMSFPYLNPSQQEAVNNVLAAKDVAIVHGPPGTGKTTTLVEAIHETLRRESQVLVCAQSNMAVDWISEKLTDRGINVLRLGNPTRVNDKMLSFTYERRFESHPDYPTLWSIRKAIRELRGTRKSSDQWHQRMDRLHARATELEIRINNDLFGSAHVIASTLVGSSSRLLEGMKFSSLFIDEAAQALEAAAWIPMRRAGRVIFAGDHCQLPPTVKSFEALRGGLGTSLMERIASMHPESVTLLTMQYRMNEEIMRFPSRWFYDDRMTAAPEVRFRGILDYDTPIEWIDTSVLSSSLQNTSQDEDNIPLFRESQVSEAGSRINRDEAIAALSTLQRYIERIGKQRFLDERIDVGVISPYRAQVQFLRHLLKHTPFFHPFRKLISVNTVDGFQGQERDVILLSMVRSNDKGEIGFLRDLRRMNVAMTRARMKLIITGDSATLSRHNFYRSLIEYIRSLKEGE